ncbi:MAG: Gfo/Idh/MocA family oxidoreductase [Syntrophaceae bacterium]
MKDCPPLNVLVVGAGMYVCGRGTNGYGTILPTLYQARRNGLTSSLQIAATSAESLIVLQDKMRGLNELWGFDQQAKLYPKAGKDPKAYRQAIQKSGKPDCAIVSVPDHLHFEITADLLKQGIHCLVVKPLAPTVAEVRELIQLAQLNGAYGAVEFHKRYDRSNLKLRDTIQQGLIGDPLYFIVEYSQRKNIPLEAFRSWVCHTNILQYLGVHYIDIIYFATRAIPRRVMALGQMNYLSGQGVGTWDSIQCFIEWEAESGVRFTSAVLTNWIDPERTSAMSDQKIKVIGTKGRYEADQKRRGITIVTDDTGMEEPNPDFSAFYGTGKGEGISIQGYGPESILQFLKDVRDIKGGMLKPGDLEGRRPTFRESLIPTVILEAANRSLAMEGSWINCELPANIQ